MPPFIEAVIERVRAWFYPLPVNQGPDPFIPIPRDAEVPVPQPLPAAPAPPVSVKPFKHKPIIVAGEFYFRETILDQLDHYFVVLRRMRHSDPDSYSLYRQIGAHVLPADLLWRDWTDTKPSQWWLDRRPGFGAVAYAVDPHSRAYEEGKVDPRFSKVHKHDPKGKKSFLPRFMYFRKYKPERAPEGMQRVNVGDVYVMTVYWDKPDDRKIKLGVPTEYGVQVMPDGEVTILRMLCRKRTRIESKKGGFSIPTQRWGIDEFFLDWAREHKRDAALYLKQLFADATRAYEQAQRQVRVDVAHAEMHAVFSVNIKRTPYFFKDRDVTVTESGAKQRIFHIVRQHVRRLAHKETTVKEHFRGLRDFVWNGYRLHITIPGLHHEPLSDFDLGMIDGDFERSKREKGVMPVSHLARLMRDAINGTPLESLRRRADRLEDRNDSHV